MAILKNGLMRLLENFACFTHGHILASVSEHLPCWGLKLDSGGGRSGAVASVRPPPLPYDSAGRAEIVYSKVGGAV